LGSDVSSSSASNSSAEYCVSSREGGAPEFVRVFVVELGDGASLEVEVDSFFDRSGLEYLEEALEERLLREEVREELV
jgi:hypothetical protein